MVVMLLPLYPLDLWNVGHISTEDMIRLIKKGSRQMYSFLKVKLWQCDWKSWTKIKIFEIKTQHTVLANSSSLNSRVQRHTIECKAICLYGIYILIFVPGEPILRPLKSYLTVETSKNKV